MAAAVARGRGRAEGAVGVLVNNAGYSQSRRGRDACRWTTCAASSRRTCSGSCACASSCCPGCARQRLGPDREHLLDGRRSSSFPGGGFYHATKYAVEAISDALRFEVKGFGVDVMSSSRA